jgi:hypothetical protein
MKFNMKKHFALPLFLTAFSLMLGSGNHTKAQTISSGDLGIGLIVAEDPTIQKLNLYKINPNGTTTLLQSNIFPERTLNTFQAAQSIVDTSTGKIYLREPDQGQGLRYRVYDAASNSFEGYTTLQDLPSGASPQFLTAPLQMNKIARREGEELHIGENSFITREANGKQEIYARDAEGNPIPLNVTNGSDLQINGRSVQGQIDANTAAINSVQDNVNDLGYGVAGATALSAALSALPTVSSDSPLSCGVGTGGYSSRYAMSIGCAVKANERLSINAGGSYVFGGGSDYGNGSLSSVAGRAGFVLRIGNIQKPLPKDQSDLKSRLDSVEKENKDLRARLAQLEAIASRLQDQAFLPKN